MSYQNTLQEADELKAKIDAYGELPQEVLKKINYKFRLEWNYTSNSMEGNSLTRRETRTVMVGLIGVNEKPIKDVMEIRKHDSVITTIMQIGAGKLNISEKRIKEIHRGIMYEEDPEKLNLVGEWKNVDNYLFNERGERFDFTPHTEVREKIHELIGWLNAEKEKIERKDKHALHPAILAFRFHIDYLTIHPFYDGNGRTARILTNLILISFGLPPVYIKEDEKNAYYLYLTDIQGYGGDRDLFYDFMGKLLLRSLQIVWNGIEGKELEEPEDLDKEIALLKRQQTPIKPQIQRSEDTIRETLEVVYFPLLKALDAQLVKFNQLFTEGTWKYFEETTVIGDKSIFPASVSLEQLLYNFEKQSSLNRSFKLKASYWLTQYNDKDNFNIEVAVPIFFHEEYYEIEVILGIPYESSNFVQAFKKIIAPSQAFPENERMLTDGSKKITFWNASYGLLFNSETIHEWAQLISKELLQLVKLKSSTDK